MVKNLPAKAGDSGSIPWQPTPVFLPGESHGQRSLAGYSPWGHKELGTTEKLTYTQVIKSLQWRMSRSEIRNFCLICLENVCSAIALIFWLLAENENENAPLKAMH